MSELDIYSDLNMVGKPSFPEDIEYVGHGRYRYTQRISTRRDKDDRMSPTTALQEGMEWINAQAADGYKYLKLEITGTGNRCKYVAIVEQENYQPTKNPE